MRRQILVAFTILAAAQAASAQAIFSPTNATVTGGGSAGSPLRTIDQSNLTINFTSGVTDFATYIASSPYHTPGFGGEWFATQGTHDSDILYDLGSVKGFDKLAFWNEEAGGVGTLNIFGSTDNVNYFSILSSLSPTNNPQAQSYLPDVFSFAATSARYVVLDMHNCPQPNQSWTGCSVGEVAFESATVDSAPEPASLVLMATGLIGMVGIARRRRAA